VCICVVEDYVRPTKTCWPLVRHADIILLLMMCCAICSQLCMQLKLTVSRCVIMTVTVETEPVSSTDLSITKGLHKVAQLGKAPVGVGG